MLDEAWASRVVRADQWTASERESEGESAERISGQVKATSLAVTCLAVSLQVGSIVPQLGVFILRLAVHRNVATAEPGLLEPPPLHHQPSHTATPMNDVINN
jgi:hypothetical protein